MKCVCDYSIYLSMPLLTTCTTIAHACVHEYVLNTFT